MAGAPQNQNRYRQRLSLKISGIYAVIGALWIFFSDQLAGMLAPTTSSLVEISIFKGWLYVISTALLLYLLISRGLKEIEKSQKALRQREQSYREIVSNIPAVVFKGYADGNVDFFDDKVGQLTGYSPEEFNSRQQKWVDIILSEDLEGAKKTLVQALKGDRSYIREYRIKTKAETAVWIQERSQIICDSEGRIVYISGVFFDVTEPKRVAQELRYAAQKWRNTFDAIGDAVALLDRDCKILQCNQSMIKFAARSFPEITGHYCWEFFYNAFGVTKECPIYRSLESRRRETKSLSVGDRWFHLIVDPILDVGGEMTGGVLLISDITPIKRAEEEIKNLNLLLQAVKEINEALLRVKTETELFQQTCDLLLKVPQIIFSWIGLVQPDSHEIKPVAWAGVEEGYLSIIKVAWDDSEYGRGPTGQAIRTAQPVVRKDLDPDPYPHPWKEEALKRGYHASITLPLIHEGEVIGILKGYAGVPDAFGEREIEFLNQAAGDIVVGIRSLRLEQELVQSLIKLKITMTQTIESMSTVVELRDPYTAGHQRDVTCLASSIAREMGVDEDRAEGLRVASLIHDIGKIVVPAEILTKPGKLNEYEMNIIRTHPWAGYDILNKIDFPWPVAKIVLQHHERLNGSGYPQSLQGSDILQEAKILAVADVVEAMAAHRPYRPALGIEAALEEINKNKGVLYDPEVVDTCVKLFTKQGFGFEKR